jgi:MSHA biogenesis protein MshJ
MATALAKKYEAFSLRERAMVAVAILGAAIYVWDGVFMQKLRNQRMALDAELTSASASGFEAQSVDLNDPRQVNLKLAAELQTRVQLLDTQIAGTASGFVEAKRMVEVLNDVLDRQGRLELVSIRNLPVVSLVPPPKVDENAAASGEPVAEVEAGPGQPPYVHAIEIVIDGQYGDILEYLEALEALPWRFRWNTLDLNTRGYPRNRVRIELSTLSLDSTWLGV